ncbi:PREDICTED: uncharacterized protein LOC105363867 [Ceratosolen solmsi marchali]|uniref:Uncharacterized protein LOC105363867 n=1 Tax=Ceratosolen solmsi marchali TaxID=326594 RepID=A0AAJ6YKX6_9HYME|nr:PREDICTED: uncharacterized protein LOC105363867 [Ceratosolen solmsi marchali]
MSNNSGPSACRRSARSKNVFESIESYCSGPCDTKYVTSYTGQSRYPVDPDSQSHNSPDKVQRKKRRKSMCDSGLEKRNKVIKRRATDFSKLRRLYEELIRVKLKDNRIPIVLIERLDDDRYFQPKLANDRKREERIQLPGLTIPAKVDPKILKCNVVVKINKRQTDSLIEVSKKRLLRLSSTSDIDERRERKSAGTLLESDIKKCTERLTDKLESNSSDDNKCNKNQPVSNSGRRHARASIDKSNNNRLPQKLRVANSRFSLNSIAESSTNEIHLESSKYSKSFIHNNRRLKRNSLDQINESNYASLYENKSKCIESTVGETNEKHSESFGKSIRRYSKNSSKDIQKYSQNASNNTEKNYLDFSVEKLPLLSSNNSVENQTESTCETNKRFPKNAEHNKRRTRNSTNKSNERYPDDSVDVCCLETSTEQHNKRFFEKFDKDIENGSKNTTESQKIFTRQMANRNNSLIQNAEQVSINRSENSIEECSKKLYKNSDKIDQCLYNETEKDRGITRNHDDRNDKHSDNLIEVRMNFIGNVVEEHSEILENVDKNVEMCMKKQTESIKKNTSSRSDKNDKNIQNVQENHPVPIQNINESSEIKSENVNKNIQKCSENLNRNIKSLGKHLDESVHLFENNSKNQFKNFENKEENDSKHSTPNCIVEESDNSENIEVENASTNKNTESFVKSTTENVTENSNEMYSKNSNNKCFKVLPIPIEFDEKCQGNASEACNESNEVPSGISTPNNFNSIHCFIEEPSMNDPNTDRNNKTVIKNIIENNKRPRKKFVGKSNDNNTPINTDDSIEKHYERLSENLNKNINERSKTPIEIINKRTTRLSDKRIDDKKVSQMQTKNIKKIRRKIIDKGEPSEILVNDKLTKKQSCMKNKSKFSAEPLMNMNDCSTVENDYNTATRNLCCKQNKNLDESEDNSAHSIQDFPENGKDISDETDKSIKEFLKLSTDKLNSLRTNLSLDQNGEHIENSLDSKQISITNSIDDNEKELPEESAKNMKNNSKIENEPMMASNESNNEHTNHHENFIENNSNSCNDPVEESIKELPKELSENLKNYSSQTSDNEEFNESHKNVKECSKSQADNATVTKNSSFCEYERSAENLIKLAMNSNQCDTKKEEKHCKESNKHIKDCLETQFVHKMATWNSSISKNDNEANNIIHNKLNYLPNDVNKNEENFSEGLQENIIKSMEIVKNVSSCKHDNHYNNIIIDKADCIQNGIFKNDESLSNDLYNNIGEYCKNQIEDNKKVSRKLSSDGHSENFIEKNLDSRNIIDKKEESSGDELQKVIKDCTKSQIENNKRVTRKSSPDKHERHIEDSVSDNSNVNQIHIENNKETINDEEHQKNYDAALNTNCIDYLHSVEKANDTDSEQLHYKENSEVPIESDATIIKNTSLKKEIVSTNFIENTVDCTPTSLDENRDDDLEDDIDNSIRAFSQNMSDFKNILQITKDKINEVCVENNLTNNSSLLTQHLIGEISEKPSECSDQNSSHLLESSEEKCEKYEKNVIDLEEDKEKYLTNFTDNNKQISEKSPQKFFEHITNDDSQYIANVLPIFSENKEESASLDRNHKIDSQTMPSESEINEGLIEDKIIPNRTDNFMDSSSTSCMQITINVNSDNEPSNDIVLGSENLIEIIAENGPNSIAEKCENYSGQCTEANDNKTILTIENTKSIPNNVQVTVEKDFEDATQQVSFTNNENEFEDYFENFIESADNTAPEIKIVDDTKAHEDLIEDIAEIRAEDLDECIRNSSKILIDDDDRSTMTTFHSNEKITEISVEHLDSKGKENNSHIPRDNVYNNVISLSKSVEDCCKNSVDVTPNNKPFFDNTPVGDSQGDGKTSKPNPISIIDKSSFSRLARNSFYNPEKTINGIIERAIIKDSVINHEARFMLSFADKPEHPITNDEMFIVERRKVTLMELKKKCTGNLDKRQSKSNELSKQKARVTRLLNIRSGLLNSSLDSMADNASENDENYRESLSEDIDSDENLTDELKRLIRQRIESKYNKKDQQQVETVVLNYPTNANLNCKDCGDDFASNRELKRHMKIKHRERLVIKITKTNENKHVTHIIEPVPKSKEEEQPHETIISEKAIIEGETIGLIDKEKRPEDESEKQDESELTKGEIKIIVKKDSGSKNSHVVKEIKITPKSAECGSGVGSNIMPPGCSAITSETVQPVKRRRGRPRKYPIYTGNELVPKQITPVLDFKNETNAPTPKIITDELIFDPVESIVLQPDIVFDNYENVTIESTSNAKAKWIASPSSRLAKMCKLRRKRRRTLSPQSQTEVFVPARKRGRPAKYSYLRDDDETASEPDFCTKYRITKELVVRLTKLDAHNRLRKGFNAKINRIGHIDDDIDDESAILAEGSRRGIVKPGRIVFGALDDGHRESIKTVARASLESNNNNVNEIQKCLSVSSIPRRMMVQREERGWGTSETRAEVGSTDVGQEVVHKSAKPRMETNAAEATTRTQLVVTPKRQTIDKTEADESQKAKLLMLMNATTPYEPAGVKTTTTESIQTLQPQTTTMQLQPQQFCILFIPDTIYTSESANKEFTPTATIVNFQPVPDAEMANRSLIYTPTTPTKISIDEHAKSYVCSTCTQVLDMIGRLEASLGMTEEDKSAIKCPYCSNHFQSLFYLEYHVMQEHLKCENEKQCRHSRFNSLRIPSHEAASEFEIYITFALKCRSCYDIFGTVLQLNDHVMHKHKTLVRLRPSMGPAAVEAVCSAYPAFARKNGIRNPGPVFQCPSDCVCRIGIRSTDTPLQRQQMLKRCPHVMRRLEKIESAAYEVYTCTLCKSTFLMKDEVVDHLMKMHEVSCKFPCYTCLTSFRSLQMQENHRCSETTLHDIDKILSIAILPTNVGGKDSNKYLEREDSSTDEYGTIKATGAKGSLPAPPPPHKNGFKRKSETSTTAAMNRAQGACLPKRAKPVNGFMKKRRRHCPKCKKRFAYYKSLQDHIIYEHILKGDGHEGPKKMAIELLKLVKEGKGNGERAHELAKMLIGHTDPDGVPLKDLTMMDEQENWEEVKSTPSKEPVNDNDLVKCIRCKMRFKMPVNSENQARFNRQHHLTKTELKKMALCESCENGGPKTRRRIVISESHNSTCLAAPEPRQLKIIHPFVCKKCTDTFPTHIELRSHKLAVHAKAVPDTCDICTKTFTSARMLQKHKKTHRDSFLDVPRKPEDEEEEEDEEETTTNPDSSHDCSKDADANRSLDGKTNSSTRRDSSDSSSAGSKEPEEQFLNCTFCEEVCSSKVSLKNHLKRAHGRRASICQFCNGLLIDTSEVRHMLDYHIVPSKSNPRHECERKVGLGGPWSRDEAGRMRDDVEELVRTLGKHRLQSLMMYHDFEGKCNNAIMRCPICPELFATRESCRFHYVWIHDDNCLLCDETFRSGSSACQHKVDAHTSTASYLWCIQRLVTAIVGTLRLDANQPSHVLYQILVRRLEDALEQERIAYERELAQVRGQSEAGASEETPSVGERFLEEVVLSEDQLPDSSNIIEVVIGKEDSEDDLLSMLNLSPNYESCEQHRLPNAGAAPPEEEDDEETTSAANLVNAMNAVPSTPPVMCATTAMAVTTTAVATTATTTTTIPVVESYVASGVCKYRLENDEEQLVLVVTDDDLVTFKDDIGSLAERISTTCDSLTLEEITDMLKAYFENVSLGGSAGGAS